MKYDRRLVLKLLGLAPLVPGLFREAVAYEPTRIWFGGGRIIGFRVSREMMEDDLDSKRRIKWSKVAEPNVWDWDG